MAILMILASLKVPSLRLHSKLVLTHSVLLILLRLHQCFSSQKNTESRRPIPGRGWLESLSSKTTLLVYEKAFAYRESILARKYLTYLACSAMKLNSTYSRSVLYQAVVPHALQENFVLCGSLE